MAVPFLNKYMDRFFDSSPVIVTLHNGPYHLDENGFVDETEEIPEIARVQADYFSGTIQFNDLPECDASHIAVWTLTGRLLLRSYCFPVEGQPEWTHKGRHIPEGGSVTIEVNI